MNKVSTRRLRLRLVAVGVVVVEAAVAVKATLTHSPNKNHNLNPVALAVNLPSLNLKNHPTKHQTPSRSGHHKLQNLPRHKKAGAARAVAHPVTRTVRVSHSSNSLSRLRVLRQNPVRHLKNSSTRQSRKCSRT